MSGLRGVYNIMATPFTGDGALDEESLRKLADATIRMGVDGITVLGVAGEAQKMLDGERRRVLELVMEINDGRVPIIVGASQNATDTTIAACKSRGSRSGRGHGRSAALPPARPSPDRALPAARRGHLDRSFSRISRPRTASR
ncbi:MAG: dihydrodipicolinate synthase family protein [Thermomicrobiales bacterium]